ncbi:DNA repair protein RecN [Aestuariivivens sediminicola]|uniref:DNA repair protein RecN n=1 Tax=Aestuariivivens sediminicola TaxID=2913560 RepID=UPI001F5A4143|nr:DNA repair protein RecN [Aestuariivivens sediminicola]
MLKSLSIKNYALIENLHVSFDNGLSIITGETGGGKSILLQGLSLILGKRADFSSLKDNSIKCIIEAVFDITNYDLKSFFKDEILDFDDQTIIRREILPSGKSRAFVNDSPVQLKSLQLLGERLIDIHSQHETLQIVDDNYQFKVIDALAGNASLLKRYREELNQFRVARKELDKLMKLKSEVIKEQDYNTFLLNELLEANLVEDELVELEEEYETLNNVEDIKEKLATSSQILNDEEQGVMSRLSELKTNFTKLANLSSNYNDLFERIRSSFIELDDIHIEIDRLLEHLEANPERLEQVNVRLGILNNLLLKHGAMDLRELISIRDQLLEKCSVTENLDDTILKKEAELLEKQKTLDHLSKDIHEKRRLAIPNLKQQLETILKDLGMPNAKFSIQLNYTTNLFSNGKDELLFLFSANKGGNFLELKKAASGGELSRIMLAIKWVLSNYIKLPTIMFDEIDTGVSGEISNKMGEIMLDMSRSMQVFTITHLPQIAAKGHYHFKVYKEDINNITQTKLIRLNHDERIVEIAQMLGGIEMSSSAIAHAKELLN